MSLPVLTWSPLKVCGLCWSGLKAAVLSLLWQHEFRENMRSCENTEKLAKKVFNFLDVISCNGNERSDPECWQQSAGISPGISVKLFPCGRNNLEMLTCDL